MKRSADDEPKIEAITNLLEQLGISEGETSAISAEVQNRISDADTFSDDLKTLNEKVAALEQENMRIRRRLFMNSKSSKEDEATAFPAASNIVSNAELALLVKERDLEIKENTSLKIQIEEIPRIRADLEAERHKNEWIKKQLGESNLSINQLSALEFNYRRLQKENESLSHTVDKQRREIEQLIKDKKAIFEDFDLALTKDTSDFKARVKAIAEDVSRMRQDRDKMRQLYEETNTILAVHVKKCTTLQESLDLLTSFSNLASIAAERHRSAISSLASNSSSAALKLCEDQIASELEDFAKILTDCQNQNKTLMKTFGEKDELYSKTLAELEFKISQVAKENESFVSQMQSLEGGLSARLRDSEDRERRARSLYTKLDEKVSTSLSEYEMMKHKYNDSRGKIEELQNQLSTLSAKSGDDYVFAKIKEAAGFKEECLIFKERLYNVEKKLALYHKGESLKNAEEELNLYKKLLKCNSCHVRDKDTVLLKCMHVFCKECINVRLETRQRKCPNCGEAFGSNDARTIYL